MKPVLALCSAAVAALLVSCGGGGYGGGSNTPPTTTGTPASGFRITIRGLAFSPLNLDVTPGATVTVSNQDGMLHSVTSEATAESYLRGGVGGVTFDTGDFVGERTFTIPANAVVGTVVPYFCSTHTSTMATRTGTITVRATAPTTPSPSDPGLPPGY
jgi:plastocyanin